MLKLEQAIGIVRKNLPKARVTKAVDFGDSYLIQAFWGEGPEAEMDPYFSVNKTTGEFRDFSILASNDRIAIVRAFTERNLLR